MRDGQAQESHSELNPVREPWACHQLTPEQQTPRTAGDPVPGCWPLSFESKTHKVRGPQDVRQKLRRQGGETTETHVRGAAGRGRLAGGTF